MNEKAWADFKSGKWTNIIDVKDFIALNYTQYNGNSDFLAQPTPRTIKVRTKVEELLAKETIAGGVLDIDTSRISSLLSWGPGYIVSKEDELIYGLQTDEPLKRAVNPFGGIKMSIHACEEYGYHLDQKLIDAFQYRTTHNDGVFRVYTEEMRKVRHTGVITGLPDAYGRGRIIGDYRRVALYGMKYLIEQKNMDKVKLGKKYMSAENIQLSEELFKQIQFMNQLVEMAKQYGDDILRPAETAREAIQWLYYAYLGAIKEQNGAANSIGRVSTFIDIYIERDLKRGILTESEAQELIDDLILKFRLVRHLRTSSYNDLFAGDPVWVTMSEAGIGLDGRHMVSKTAYRVLQTLYNLAPSAEPNITILWSKNLPESYKLFCAQVSTDTDAIQYENDDVMRPEYGDDYAIACCVSALKTGKQMQYFGARCNIAKVLLMALNGGRDEMTGEQVGPKGDTFPAEKLDYEKVLQAYNHYSSWLAKLYVNTLNVIHFMHDKYAYERLMMSFHDTDVERLMAFGICGLSVLADSLSAIKYATVTPIKDDTGLIVDYKIEGDFPKYGNDDDRADDIACWIVKDFYKKLITTKPHRKAIHTLSILTITSNVVYGKKTGSTPDGRKKGEPFAPGANPMHKRDSCGAIASLNSVAKLSFACCRDGISNTFTVTPDILGENPKERADRLVSLLDGYFLQEAHHLNVNVLNREKLLDAMDHPEKYPNLTIRVSGYAVNFNKLSRKQQTEVIDRTFHASLS
ncbi:MAG: formate C-acetyltransferase [Christensenellaceae bacterium]|jgi:formate C-acetyltransferase|nr:formate C-acetyltransferase [Christensenellaceae bacterium]